MVTQEVSVNNAANLALFMVNVSKALLPTSDAISINDLKSHYRGLRYIQELLKLLPQNEDIIKNPALTKQVSALGRIHDLKMTA